MPRKTKQNNITNPELLAQVNSRNKEAAPVGLLYCCYSANLKEFLYRHGFRYDLCALNPNNHKMFWAYLRTGELSTALDEWSANK